MIRILAIAFMLIAPKSLYAEPVQQEKHREQLRDLYGFPLLTNVQAVVGYVTKEDNITQFQGPTAGSSFFIFELSSGEKTDNWKIDTIFGFLFSPFGKESIPTLITLLDHKHEYVRYGARNVLSQKTGRKNRRYDFRSISAKNAIAINDWKSWWEENKDNPRLDSFPMRIYEAPNWDQQTVSNK